jgi:hypothetical protein
LWAGCAAKLPLVLSGQLTDISRTAVFFSSKIAVLDFSSQPNFEKSWLNRQTGIFSTKFLKIS